MVSIVVLIGIALITNDADSLFHGLTANLYDFFRK